MSQKHGVLLCFTVFLLGKHGVVTPLDLQKTRLSSFSSPTGGHSQRQADVDHPGRAGALEARAKGGGAQIAKGRDQLLVLLFFFFLGGLHSAKGFFFAE